MYTSRETTHGSFCPQIGQACRRCDGCTYDRRRYSDQGNIQHGSLPSRLSMSTQVPFIRSGALTVRERAKYMIMYGLGFLYGGRQRPKREPLWGHIRCRLVRDHFPFFYRVAGVCNQNHSVTDMMQVRRRSPHVTRRKACPRSVSDLSRRGGHRAKRRAEELAHRSDGRLRFKVGGPAWARRFPESLAIVIQNNPKPNKPSND